MPEDLIVTAAAIATILFAAALVRLASPKNLEWKWLGFAALLILINDVALTLIYGLLPDFVGGEKNWLGKLIALAITLLVANHPALGWQRCGLTLSQNQEGKLLTYSVAIGLVLLFGTFAILAEPTPWNAENVAFQLSMPGIEEESFYRGVLLFSLNQAMRGQWRFGGIGWTWGALLSSIVFGLTHALSFDGSAFQFVWMAFAFTAIPALALLWLRERTGSLVLPVILHNFANSASYFI